MIYQKPNAFSLFHKKRFKSVSQRNILRPIVNDKYVEMFSNYERDLIETEKTFDLFKVNYILFKCIYQYVLRYQRVAIF